MKNKLHFPHALMFAIFTIMADVLWLNNCIWNFFTCKQHGSSLIYVELILACLQHQCFNQSWVPYPDVWKNIFVISMNKPNPISFFTELIFNVQYTGIVLKLQTLNGIILTLYSTWEVELQQKSTFTPNVHNLVCSKN